MTAIAKLNPTDSGRTSFDYVVKCIFVGEPFTGKSSLISNLAQEHWNNEREPTIGLDFHSFNAVGFPPNPTIKLRQGKHDPLTQNTYYKLQVWDCAGQIRFRSIVKSYYRLAQLVFVVFDLTDMSSLTLAQGWIEDVNKNVVGERPIIVLLGNKSDLACKVSDADISAFVTEHDINHYQAVSAKTGENVREAFNVGLSLLHALVANDQSRAAMLTKAESFSLVAEESNSSSRCSSCQ